MIVMVIFAIKLVCVASVCVTPASGTSGKCSDLESTADMFVVHVDKKLTPGGGLEHLSTENFSFIGLCAVACDSNWDCLMFDYNCLTGDCVQYYYTDTKANALNQLVTQNGHTSGSYP